MKDNNNEETSDTRDEKVIISNKHAAKRHNTDKSQQFPSRTNLHYNKINHRAALATETPEYTHKKVSQSHLDVSSNVNVPCYTLFLTFTVVTVRGTSLVGTFSRNYI